MILDIITNPNPILRKIGKELTLEELKKEETQKLIDDLIETMYVEAGAGIAASQVGQSLQICIIAKTYTRKQTEDLVLVNPTWTRLTVFKEEDDEGCLSVPLIFGRVKRFRRIRVNALDRHGKKIKFNCKNFFARVIQHETDHLNGVLFIDKAADLRKVEKKEAE